MIDSTHQYTREISHPSGIPSMFELLTIDASSRVMWLTTRRGVMTSMIHRDPIEDQLVDDYS